MLRAIYFSNDDTPTLHILSSNIPSIKKPCKTQIVNADSMSGTVNSMCSFRYMQTPYTHIFFLFQDC